MAELSPAAQAVLDAAYDSLDKRGYVSDQVAAALRAAADQVVPLSTNRRQNDIRAALIAITAELENFND